MSNSWKLPPDTFIQGRLSNMLYRKLLKTAVCSFEKCRTKSECQNSQNNQRTSQWDAQCYSRAMLCFECMGTCKGISGTLEAGSLVAFDHEWWDPAESDHLIKIGFRFRACPISCTLCLKLLKSCFNSKNILKITAEITMPQKKVVRKYHHCFETSAHTFATLPYVKAILVSTAIHWYAHY